MNVENTTPAWPSLGIFLDGKGQLLGWRDMAAMIYVLMIIIIYGKQACNDKQKLKKKKKGRENWWQMKKMILHTYRYQDNMIKNMHNSKTCLYLSLISLIYNLYRAWRRYLSNFNISIIRWNWHFAFPLKKQWDFFSSSYLCDKLMSWDIGTPVVGDW